MLDCIGMQGPSYFKDKVSQEVGKVTADTNFHLCIWAFSSKCDKTLAEEIIQIMVMYHETGHFEAAQHNTP